MKKFWFEIILVIIGIILLSSTDPDPNNATILRNCGLGAILFAVVWFFINISLLKKNQKHDKTFPTKKRNNTSNAFPTKQRKEVYQSSNVPQQSIFKSNKDEERKKILDEQIGLLRKQTDTKIIGPEDIEELVEITLNSREIMYICQNIICQLFDYSTTILDINEKIDSLTLSDEQAVKIFKYGTPSVRERLIDKAKSNSWVMPINLFDYLFSTDRMMLLTFTCYSSTQFVTLINKLKPYELLGYRVDQREVDEETEGMFRNCLTNQDIPYYENKDTDVVFIAEQCFSDYDNVRKLAFDKIFAGPCDLIETIKRLDSLTEYEVQKLFERQNDEEIEAMFDRHDSDDVINNLPPKYAIKIVLGLIPSTYSDRIHEDFDFDSIDHKVWSEIFEELTPDELAGYHATGDHDIIKLIEDHVSDDDDLRTAAFDKVLNAHGMKEIIESLDNIREDEVQKIMKKNDPEVVEALLGRSDSNDIITSLPEDVAIKIRLELIYSSASENVKDNYSFNDSKMFVKVIEELSPYELLGYIVSKQGNSDEKPQIQCDADFDIIKLIEDEMNDDSKLRQLAFDKMCGANDMSDAISRWDNVTESEVVQIIKRDVAREMEALEKRSDFENDIVNNLPDEFIIKQFLLDDNDTIKDEYVNRIDDDPFRKKVENITKSLLLKKMTKREEKGDVSNLSDDIVIKVHLSLIDLNDYDDCTFDSDDVSNEFVERMENNDEFKAKVQKLVKEI